MKSKLIATLILTAFAAGFAPVFAQEPVFEIESEWSQAYIDYMNKDPEERKNLRMPFPINVRTMDDDVRTYAELPLSFNSRDYGFTTSVKDQMSTGTCWTFSGIANLETFLKRQRYGSDLGNFDFSERHMDQAVAQNPNDLKNPGTFGLGFDSNGNPIEKPINTGGSMVFTSAYYMRGSGPVEEADMPFKNYTFGTVDGVNTVLPENYEPTANLYQKPSARVLDYWIVTQANNNTPEESFEVFEYNLKLITYVTGSVDVGIYMDDYANSYNSGNAAYYNPNNGVNNNFKTNHAVLLVGWDDNYPKENFVKTPSRDGAWIIKNSWGEKWGDGGYFYVSYDEKSIYAETTAVIAAEENIEYDNAYVLDPLGWNSKIGLSSTAETDEISIFGKNIFTKPEGVEELTEVTIGYNYAAGYEIYVDPDGTMENIDDAIPSASGSLKASGYTTAKLDEPILLTGDTFAIAVKYIRNGTYVDAPVEMKYDVFSTATANHGTSYVSTNGTSWTEISNESNYYANCSIKAFTKDVTEKTKITFNKENPNVLVSVFENDMELTPKADGTYSAIKGKDYGFAIKEYGQEDISGEFTTLNRDETVFYQNNAPVSITTAKKHARYLIDDMVDKSTVSQDLDEIRANLAKEVGSTFKIAFEDGFLQPVTNEKNGYVKGEAVVENTVTDEVRSLFYDDVIFKTIASVDDNKILVEARSDTKGKIIMAGYDAEGKQLGMNSTEIDIKANEDKEFDLLRVSGAAKTKIFLWTEDNMYPCAEVIIE